MAVSQQQPFCNPKIPFTGSLLGGLQEGKSVVVIGRILPKAGRFHVNLQCGSHSDADVALHFDPRYDDLATVVLNTFQNCSWGSEERKSDSFFSLHDQPFILQILVTKETYKISVNGKHFMDYRHRIPFTRVDTITVDQIDLDFIGYQNPVVVPYKAVINGGLQPGKDIVIYGLPNLDSKM